MHNDFNFFKCKNCLGFLISLGQIILPMQKINEILLPTSADVANTAKHYEVIENFED